VYVHIKPDKLSFTILYLDKLIPPTDILNRKRKTLGESLDALEDTLKADYMI